MPKKDTLILSAEQDGKTFVFGDLLYRSQCGICQEYNLEWEANFDADGTTYQAKCCGMYYSMGPATHKVNVEKDILA